jgi:hypothetical protein
VRPDPIQRRHNRLLNGAINRERYRDPQRARPTPPRGRPHLPLRPAPRPVASVIG